MITDEVQERMTQDLQSIQPSQFLRILSILHILFTKTAETKNIPFFKIVRWTEPFYDIFCCECYSKVT